MLFTHSSFAGAAKAWNVIRSRNQLSIHQVFLSSFVSQKISSSLLLKADQQSRSFSRSSWALRKLFVSGIYLMILKLFTPALCHSLVSSLNGVAQYHRKIGEKELCLFNKNHFHFQTQSDRICVIYFFAFHSLTQRVYVCLVESLWNLCHFYRHTIRMKKAAKALSAFFPRSSSSSNLFHSKQSAQARACFEKTSIFPISC